MAGIIITVGQQKGGAGKTTLASNLAIAMMNTLEGQVAVLDVDPQGSLGEWFERREQRLGEDNTGLSFRTASGWGARREARALARDFACVIVDTPPQAERDARPAVEAADLVVVPVQPTPKDIWATHSTIAMANVEKTPVILVLNRVPARARLTDEMTLLLRNFEESIANHRLGNRVVFAEAVGRGVSASELQPRGKAAAEIDGLTDEILSRIESG
jgi:chromosome partitioning protein